MTVARALPVLLAFVLALAAGHVRGGVERVPPRVPEPSADGARGERRGTPETPRHVPAVLGLCAPHAAVAPGGPPGPVRPPVAPAAQATLSAFRFHLAAPGTAPGHLARALAAARDGTLSAHSHGVPPPRSA